jgi:hypothetical protein
VALIGAASARTTVAAIAAMGLGLALWGTLSPAVRAAPALAGLRGVPANAGIKGPRPDSDVGDG